MRLKARIFPFDDVDMDGILAELARHKFIARYQVGGLALIQVRSFGKHQQIPPKEPRSVLPADKPQAVESHENEATSFQERDRERNGNKEREGGGETQAPSAQDVVDVWNQSVTAPIPQVTRLTADRKAKIDARLKTYPDLASWRTAIAWINGQAWCRAPGTGQHPNWTATLDWLCKTDGNIQRGLERAAVVAPPVAEWACPHLERCANRSMCQQASILGRPVREEVAAS